MKVAITGHTKGIGKSIYEYFTSIGAAVSGFSRSNGFDISIECHREMIINSLNDVDIFVNNAFNDYDNSQLIMLEEVLKLWKDKNKIIINISSRWTESNSVYSKLKLSLDELCNQFKREQVYIINLKPGLIDTDRVKNLQGARMDTNSIVKIIDFVLKNKDNFRVHSITFGK